ncbi:sigma-70 family RNA polymerase sigma factor [Paraglaciecola agarilytica]|uniref:RNA polymerase sigma factor n=1 Tax=Paraglaciecola chathamensis TaxID=368405 RepID=UPI001C088088|nr:sigma-70 family RNA polymerase sigma factor [Paraglaciecola agarilytica]MBU3016766.1 sigma-70 family RNA polymerase sigma factor [Paraglaciecola agarilytica]
MPNNVTPLSTTQQINQLFRSYKVDLVRNLRGIFGSGPPDPEDLVQEAFSKLLTHKDVDNIQHPKAYLTRAAVNMGLNHCTKYKQTELFIDGALESAGETLVTVDSPEDIYSLNQRVSSVSDAMNELSDKQREIVIRSRIHGETYEQIRNNTGWSLADISRQLKSAISVLADASASEES